MTRDQIIALAKKAGLQLSLYTEAYPVITEQLERFANLVRNQAIEEAAEKCHEKEAEYIDMPGRGGWVMGAFFCADSIRSMKT